MKKLAMVMVAAMVTSLSGCVGGSEDPANNPGNENREHTTTGQGSDPNAGQDQHPNSGPDEREH